MQGIKRYRFGEGLELPEQQWLAQEINVHLEDLNNGAPVDFNSMPAQEMPQVFEDNEPRG